MILFPDLEKKQADISYAAHGDERIQNQCGFPFEAPPCRRGSSPGGYHRGWRGKLSRKKAQTDSGFSLQNLWKRGDHFFPYQFFFIANVINMFRFDDAIEPSFTFAGLPFPGGKRQTHNVGSKESEHIYDNLYKTEGAMQVVDEDNTCQMAGQGGPF